MKQSLHILSTITLRITAYILLLSEFPSVVAQQTPAQANRQEVAAIAGQRYFQQLSAPDGQPPIHARILNGTLPFGLALSSEGIISGTPIQLGTFSLEITLTISQGQLSSLTLVLKVDSNGPIFLIASLPPGRLGFSYNASLDVLASSPISLVLSEGRLPRGLDLTTMGQLRGIPTEMGSFVVSIRATDSLGRTAELRTIISISPSTSLLQIGSLPPEPLVCNLPQRYAFSAVGGIQPYNWKIESGRLPIGMTLDQNSGLLRGTPYVPGKYSFLVSVADQTGSKANKEVEIRVLDKTNLLPAEVGLQYNAFLRSQSQAFLQVRISPKSIRSFPPGLTLTNDGRLFGSPTTQGIYAINTIESSPDGLHKEVSWSLAVINTVSRFKVTSLDLPPAIVGSYYNQSLQSSGGQGEIRWKLRSGRLPAGLKFEPAGLISGIPTEATAMDIEVEASDSTGLSAIANVALYVNTDSGPMIHSIVDAASYSAKGVAPGQMILIFGNRLGSRILSQGSAVSGVYPSALSGTRVLFDGVPAPLIYTSFNQICVSVPMRLRGNTHSIIQVEHDGWQSSPVAMTVLPTLPGIFTTGGTGIGQAAAFNQDGSLNSSSNPATGGGIVVIYVNGASGQILDEVDGSISSSSRNSRIPSQVLVGGIPTETLYAGQAPGLVLGLSQFNFKAPIGPSGSVSLAVKAGDAVSPGGPVIWLK